ncbi:MAG: DUF882 domain-containing protein [Armatimonadota bacterium]|nr:DUF882 domain-containing protein [Armatimonadota bacterium]MDR7450606.1 DUF882 domain-containing protein [Armatimonadota bacterium]MDR7466261.1 DUF882 domain-containing protein [Armatimonadota bacterium]MDR7492982.1 DUF882 domain-containing protein [Armatimonadota bacterium]MDR7498261.1 DUF882 domain-containing protein [Armatimonadota bacterium]
MRRRIVGAVGAVLLLSCSTVAAPAGRFFLEGDGTVHLINVRTGAGGAIRYRTPRGDYPPSARKRLNEIFGVPPDAPVGMALRLIALLDYLQDRLHGGRIRIISGYRSPGDNEALRRQGRLAARTSLHLEGMAADIAMEGVSGHRLWTFVRSLDCCGAGYYRQTQVVHLDVGPSRFWDETTTRVEQDLGAKNRLLLLRTEWDRYRPGEEVRLTLGRITDYPVGVRRDGQLVHAGGAVAGVRLDGVQTDCLLLRSPGAARALVWTIPKAVPPTTRARIRLSFCQRLFPEMPEATDSNPISVR